MTVEHLLVLDRGQVVTGGVLPAVLVPVDSLQRRELDVIEALPRPAAVDQLGLEQPDVGLGQRVVAASAVPALLTAARGMWRSPR